MKHVLDLVDLGRVLEVVVANFYVLCLVRRDDECTYVVLLGVLKVTTG